MTLTRLARPRRHRRWISTLAAASVLLISAVLTACGSSSSSAKPAPSSSPVLPSSPGAGHTFYISLGDSYAAGYQPAVNGGLGKTSANGFAYQLASKATLNGRKLTLVNFACAGATTTSLLKRLGCTQDRLGPGAIGYPKQTQADAAVAYIAAHKADVGLITVSISGNDITSCATASGTSGIVSCVTKALATVKANLHTLLPRLRAAAPDARIVGLTYPDVILGLYVSKTSSGTMLASLSVTAFKSLINPALKAEYDAVGGSFIDVTDASGGYIPFTQTTTLAPYGTIPTAVAQTCELTYYCEFHNIHPKTVGYTLIADLIRESLPA